MNTTNSQAASIADDNEFHDALMKWLIDGDYHIEDGALICKGWDGLIACLDAKLAQAREEATGRLAIAFEKMLCAANGSEWSATGISASSLVDDLRKRIIAAEQALAVMRRSYQEAFNAARRVEMALLMGPDEFVSKSKLLALLQSQGQAEISDWREKASAEFDSKEPLKNTESQ